MVAGLFTALSAVQCPVLHFFLHNTTLIHGTHILLFYLLAGGFSSPWPMIPREAAATAANHPPDRPPDFIAEEQTTAEQAALYRLGREFIHSRG